MKWLKLWKNYPKDRHDHCLKSVRIRSYSGQYFPAFGLNTDRYGVSIGIQSECRKIRTRIFPNIDTFYAVDASQSAYRKQHSKCVNLNLLRKVKKYYFSKLDTNLTKNKNLWKSVKFILTVCSYNATYAFKSKSTLYSCLNVKELIARNRCDIWNLSDCNGTRTHNYLARKRTLNHLAKLA